MPDFIKINGTAVRTTGFYRRVITNEGKASQVEVELVVIIRGSMAIRSFKQLLSSPSLVVDSPHGTKWERFAATVENAQVASSGEGEAAAYRFDLNLRETPESAAKREAEREQEPEEPAAKPPTFIVKPSEYEEDLNAPADLSAVTLSTSSASWGAAVQQLKRGGRPEPPPEPPLTQVERAGIEAVLVNLRMDALIEQLEAIGMLKPGAVDAVFTRLVQKRFVTDATPLVGEKIAKRAERDLLG
jgi:hypothetical protein